MKTQKYKCLNAFCLSEFSLSVSRIGQEKESIFAKRGIVCPVCGKPQNNNILKGKDLVAIFSDVSNYLRKNPDKDFFGYSLQQIENTVEFFKEKIENENN